MYYMTRSKSLSMNAEITFTQKQLYFGRTML